MDDFSHSYSAYKPHLKPRSTGQPFTARPKLTHHPLRRDRNLPTRPSLRPHTAVPAGSCSPQPRRRTAVSRRRGAVPAGSRSPLPRPPTGRCPRGTLLPDVLRVPSRPVPAVPPPWVGAGGWACWAAWPRGRSGGGRRRRRRALRAGSDGSWSCGWCKWCSGTGPALRCGPSRGLRR